MEETPDKQKLGDTLEFLNDSIKNKDLENALKTFKLIKENKYSLKIQENVNFDKENYNGIFLDDKNIQKGDDDNIQKGDDKNIQKGDDKNIQKGDDDNIQKEDDKNIQKEDDKNIQKGDDNNN